MKPRVVELFCGMGGFAESAGDDVEVVLAADASSHVLEIYKNNFKHNARQMNLQSAHADLMAKLDADIWWMSPPCQPHTVRGNQLDLSDPRSASFEKVLEFITEVGPRAIGMENVEGFKSSDAHRRLLGVLERAGYHVTEEILCPTQFGVPNKRPRYYMAARKDAVPVFKTTQVGRPFQTYLEKDLDPRLVVRDQDFQKYGKAFLIVDAEDPDAMTSCFTSAYGKSWVFSGSYLRQDGVLRRFSARELLNFMHFRPEFEIPDSVSLKKSWKYIGNSLSIPPTRSAFDALVAESP